MAGLRGDAMQLRRRSDSRCSWRRIANHSCLSAAAASDSASCAIMSGKRGATWRREPTYPGEDRRSAADPDRWDDLGDSKENAIYWFARAPCHNLARGVEGATPADFPFHPFAPRARVFHPQLHPHPTIPSSIYDRLRVILQGTSHGETTFLCKLSRALHFGAVGRQHLRHLEACQDAVGSRF